MVLFLLVQLVSNMNQIFAGIDVSTQSQKLVVIDLDNDSIIYSDSINYDNDLPDYETFNGVIRNNPPGVSESDPNTVSYTHLTLPTIYSV